MFKRVQKRQRKQEKEEELGLDSELKEVLGLQDTDSEESDSGSDDSSDESGSEDEGDAIASGEEDQEELEEMESDAEDSAEEDEIPPMSVMEAVSDPLYVVSLDPDVRACILCPGKLLKNTRMSDIHKASKAHNRRFTKFVELVQKAGPEGDVRNLIRMLNAESTVQPQPKEEGSMSKRAAKRKEKLAALKAKREKHKQIVARKRKQAKASESSSKTSPQKTADQPPKKKRKVADGDEEAKLPPAKGEQDPAATVTPVTVSSMKETALVKPAKPSKKQSKATAQTAPALPAPTVDGFAPATKELAKSAPKKSKPSLTKDHASPQKPGVVKPRKPRQKKNAA